MLFESVHAASSLAAYPFPRAQRYVRLMHSGLSRVLMAVLARGRHRQDGTWRLDRHVPQGFP